MKLLSAIMAAASIVATPAFAAEPDTITIGFTASRTGPLNVDSTGQERGYEFWRDEVNAKGGIKVGDKHYQVKFVSYDDQSVGGRVQQLYTRLINQDRAQFLFSPYSSGLVAPAAIISEQYGKVMIDSGGAEEKPFELGNKHLFMVITSASHYLSGAVDALKSKNPHAKVALIYSDDPFSKTVLAAAREQAKAAGLDVALDESYAPSTTDFGPIVNKVISSNAEALLGGGHYSDGATLARQLLTRKPI
jgi:branched-chain amino acid transport system substrate-binding protein